MDSEVGFVLMFIFLIIVIALGACAFMWWKVFEKAGKKGWISIVPYYNRYTLFQISGKPGWWFALGFVPYVGFIIVFVMRLIANIELAKKFGKSSGFGIGLSFLGIVFFPILGYGSAVYEGGVHTDLSQHTDILDAEHALGQDSTGASEGGVPH